MLRSGRLILASLVPLAAVLGIAPTAAAVDAASPVQRSILELLFVILIFALIVGVLVHVLLFAAVRWFRDSPRWRPPKGPPRTHDKRLEIGWTAGPVVILAAVTVLTWTTLVAIERPAEYHYAIDVYGAQWAWRFAYPDGNTSSGTMYIQEKLTFLLRIHSDDVIHSFYVPDLGIKIDAVPGVTNVFWVRADRTGAYTVNCAEFCGVGHSQMNGEVVVFREGSQPVPYGPPPSAPRPGGGAARYTIVDVAFKESGGSPWSMDPSRIELGQNFNVTLRVWNNESGLHQLRIGPPYDLIAPDQPGLSERPVILNFRTNWTGQIPYWCDIPGHRALGMEGILNVTGPQDITIVLREAGIDPPRIRAGLGWTVNLTITNLGSSPRSFGIGPPYGTRPIPIPAGGSERRTIILNRTASSTWYGDQAGGITGELSVLAAGVAPPPPPPPPGFPIIEITAGLLVLSGLAALAFNVKLARDARRREQLPSESEE